MEASKAIDNGGVRIDVKKLHERALALGQEMKQVGRLLRITSVRVQAPVELDIDQGRQESYIELRLDGQLDCLCTRAINKFSTP